MCLLSAKLQDRDRLACEPCFWLGAGISGAWLLLRARLTVPHRPELTPRTPVRGPRICGAFAE